ncbi:MAG: TonB-dependent receptor [Bdellovibrionota bacterium]|nr:MAG: TonB-dependent receptor [Bdellovibrionota bacterium]
MNQTAASAESNSSDLPEQKALRINLDLSIFGTFAEIGAGQEVARHFFRAGGAAGTIAKTMSAYDMTFSDEIYGKVGRYVSLERLISMLDHEYDLLLDRLATKRGSTTRFFVFADTVAARSFKSTNECHGWLGIRFQATPLEQPSQVVIHLRLLDRENLQQQQALGNVGVNLIHGAFFARESAEAFIRQLLDGVSTERIEIDMIEFSGPAFAQVNNRLASIMLVRQGLTPAVLFAPDGKVLQPSEVLYKHPVLVERGRFQPVTQVHIDMLERARKAFTQGLGKIEREPIILFELTLNNLLASEGLSNEDLLVHAETLTALGRKVLISEFPESHRLITYFRRYTSEPLGVVVGVDILLQFFNEEFYSNLSGGILEGLSRFFLRNVRLYVYPMLRDRYVRFLQSSGLGALPAEPSQLPEVLAADDISVQKRHRHLYDYLVDAGFITSLREYDKECLQINSQQVSKLLLANDPAWEKFVPAPAVQVIKSKGLTRLAQLRKERAEKGPA